MRQIERDDERGKREGRKRGRERRRKRERARVRVAVSTGGSAAGVDGCIVEAHALELDEHLSLHIRVSIFFPLASGTLSSPVLPSLASIPPAVSPFPPFSLAFYFKRALG